jgi:hypothetical protein
MAREVYMAKSRSRKRTAPAATPGGEQVRAAARSEDVRPNWSDPEERIQRGYGTGSPHSRLPANGPGKQSARAQELERVTLQESARVGRLRSRDRDQQQQMR